MKIETERLVVRSIIHKDFDTLYQIHSDPNTNLYNPAGPVKDRATFVNTFNSWLAHHQKYGFGYYTLIDKEDRCVFGLCGLRFTEFEDKRYLNLYYRISPNKIRQGFVKEAANAIIDYVLEMTDYAYPIMVLTLNTNIPSIKTAEALGLIYDSSFDDINGNGNVYFFKKK